MAQLFAPVGVTAIFTENDSDLLIETAGPNGVFKDGVERGAN